MNITTMEALEQVPVGTTVTVNQHTSGPTDWLRNSDGLALNNATLPLRNFESYIQEERVTIPDNVPLTSPVTDEVPPTAPTFVIGQQVTRETGLYDLPVGTVMDLTALHEEFTIESSGPDGRMCGDGYGSLPLSAQTGTFAILSIPGQEPVDHQAVRVTELEAEVQRLWTELVQASERANRYGQELSGALSEYIGEHGGLTGREREDLIEVMEEQGLDFIKPMEDVTVSVVIDGYTDVTLSISDLQRYVDSDLTVDDSAEVQASWRVELERTVEVEEGACACDTIDLGVVEDMMEESNISYDRISDYRPHCRND